MYLVTLKMRPFYLPDWECKVLNPAKCGVFVAGQGEGGGIDRPYLYFAAFLHKISAKRCVTELAVK